MQAKSLRYLPKRDSSTYDGLETTDFLEAFEMCD